MSLLEEAIRGPKTEKTPLVGSVQFGGMPAHTSTDGLLNTSSNVILHFRLHSLERMSTINFALAICSLVYLAINIVMIVFNWTANFDGDLGLGVPLGFGFCWVLGSDMGSKALAKKY